MGQSVVDVQGQELSTLVMMALVVEDLLKGLLLLHLEHFSAFEAVLQDAVRECFELEDLVHDQVQLLLWRVLLHQSQLFLAHISDVLAPGSDHPRHHLRLLHDLEQGLQRVCAARVASYQLWQPFHDGLLVLAEQFLL